MCQTNIKEFSKAIVLSSLVQEYRGNKMVNAVLVSPICG